MDPSAPSRLPALLLVLLLLPLLTACGGSERAADGRLTKARYIERFNALQAEYVDLFEEVDEGAGSREAAFVRLARFDAFIADVDELDPPEEWQEEHDQMAAALVDMRRAMDQLSRTPPQRTARVERHVGEFTAAQDRFAEAVTKVNASR